MSKTQRIEDLEREVDQLHVIIGRLSDRITAVEAQQQQPAVSKPSLVDQARQRAAEYGDRILEGLGF